MNPARLAVVASLVIILGVPFLFRPADAGRAPDAGEARLVVITPHIEHLRIEFARGFSEWHELKYGEPVWVDFRQPGGTSEIRKQLIAQYDAAYRRGDIAADGSCPPGTMPYDILFGGGSYEHDQMKRGVAIELPGGREGTLPISVPLDYSQSQLDEWFGENSVGSAVIYDPDQYWLGTAMSSFGIVYNRDLLERLGLEPPRDWESLTDPRYAGWLALADPRQSGSVATTFESILNNYGWEKGWRTLRAMCANAQYFAASSTKAPLDVSAGEAAAGLAIDFYGRYQSQALREPGGGAESSRVGYLDPEGLVFVDPDPVSILRGGPHPELARRFVEYLLTEQGQSVWQLPAKGDIAPADAFGPREYELRRMPVRRVMYDRHFEQFIDKVNPFEVASDAPSLGWRSMISPLMGAFGIDLHHDCRAAWEAMHAIRAGADAGELDARALADAGFESPSDAAAHADALFFAMPVHRFADGREVVFSAETYDEVRNDWRDPLRAAELKIAYTRFFRANYERVVELARELGV
jgi:ABC-type Fe3+ transport system substrate-binding protein